MDIFLVAEVGCNHGGSLQRAKDYIQAAKKAGARIVKFQKRSMPHLYSAATLASPHPDPRHAFGDSYGAHREYLEFDLPQHQELKLFCDELGIEYHCSVWDEVSLREIASLKPRGLKIPSACNQSWSLLEQAIDLFPGELHVSLGMTTRVQVDEVVKFFEAKQAGDRLILYACTSVYPTADEDVCLLELSRLRVQYGKRVKAIGFSGHHLGIVFDPIALALGAQYIERHFTLDKTQKGTDHALSLEPSELAELAKNLARTQSALCDRGDDMVPAERPYARKLRPQGTI